MSEHNCSNYGGGNSCTLCLTEAKAKVTSLESQVEELTRLLRHDENDTKQILDANKDLECQVGAIRKWVLDNRERLEGGIKSTNPEYSEHLKDAYREHFYVLGLLLNFMDEKVKSKQNVC